MWRERLTTVLGDLPHYLEPSVSGSRGTGAIRSVSPHTSDHCQWTMFTAGMPTGWLDWW